ncbi:alpha/beta hydrolase [Maridesulfovibrio bastinii]|uniref:alpha/beta hydrolase n=1 Tax=Maridesulfovibrio bastinii TaxID=47157 RepID=UPI0003F8CA59|nr:alpha/beta fold hydrolase [Maridesulfovibrio bastinii]
MKKNENHVEGSSMIVLEKMGSFMFGGSVSTESNGDTLHVNHGYAQFGIPYGRRQYPLVMWHGFDQSGRCWENTPDGRDGFMQIFLRRHWPVYLIDQPKRGRAGRAKNLAAASALTDSFYWNFFRFGEWNPPAERFFYPGVLCPQDSDSIDQALRQVTVNTGVEPFPDRAERDFMAETVADLFHKIDAGILLTHSHSGQYGWATAMKEPARVKAVVAYEPASFAFPENEPPADIPSDLDIVNQQMAPQLYSLNDFNKLTEMPILIVLGDNFHTEKTNSYPNEFWRVARARTFQFAAAVNSHGGDATIMDLPAMGIHGNSHFIFADLNSNEIADLLSDFLMEKGLAGCSHHHW